MTSVGLFPYLRSGSEDMSFTIGGVVKLVGPNGIGKGFGVSFRLVVVVLGIIKSDS